MSFEFTRNGVVFRFHTEVGGDQTARCVLDEEQQPEQPMEPEEE